MHFFFCVICVFLRKPPAACRVNTLFGHKRLPLNAKNWPSRTRNQKLETALMPIRTIFNMAEDCARGERQGWYEFVRDFAGMVRKLLLHYFPSLEPEIEQHVVAVFERARQQNGAWFGTLHFANEREFLMSFRELVFAYGREHARLPTPPVSLEQMRTVMADLTVVERELLWLFVKGYTAEQIAPMMMNAAATSQA